MSEKPALNWEALQAQAQADQEAQRVSEKQDATPENPSPPKQTETADAAIPPIPRKPIQPVTFQDEKYVHIAIPEEISLITYSDCITEALAIATASPTIPANIYQRKGSVVRISGIKKGERVYNPARLNPKIELLTPDTLTYEVSRSIKLFETKSDPAKDPYEVKPHVHIIKNVLAASTFPFAELDGVFTHPTINQNGDIISGPYTYDETSRRYIATTSGLSIEAGNIPENPSDNAVQEAVSLILDILQDFPFKEQADRANALALFLTVLCRPLITGQVPAFLVQAPQAGTGKGLLVKTLLYAATGSKPETLIMPDNDAELKKLMLSKLLEGAEFIFFDNVDVKIKSGALCGIITSDVYGDRLLGLNKTVYAPVYAPVIFTANNPVVTGDMPRRVIPIRLDAGLEDPSEGRVFKHPRLEQYLAKRRGIYIQAGLTLAKAWVSRGRGYNGREIGSFEDWSVVIGGILQTAGVDGFLGNRREFLETADTEKAAWTAFVQKWYDQHKEEPVLAKDLLQLAQEAEAVSDKTTVRGFGMYLKQKQDQVIAGYKITRIKKSDNQYWYLKPLKSE
jgi:hypothetical protein